jgi:hypothetical protein
MLNYKNKNKGQVGQTVFWLIATLVIVVTLIIFIIVSISMSTIKDIKLLLSSNVKSDLNGQSQIFIQKTILAEELNDANQAQIEEILKQNEK